MTDEEIKGQYEKETGTVILEALKETGVQQMHAALVYSHGPFTWGKDAHEAVHNSVVLEEVAKMAAQAEVINPKLKLAPQEMQDKHFFRKHGANAYYGQN